MKRLRSSDDLDSYGDKGGCKEWGRRDEDMGLSRSSSYRSFNHKSENGRKGLSASSSRYDRLDDDRDISRTIRKRSDYDVDNYDRRKSYDRHRDGSDRGILSSSPRGGYAADRIYRSESFSGPRKDFPKGFRSERDRSRREGSVSSWRRFSAGKDSDDGNRCSGDSARGSRVASEDTARTRSPPKMREAKSPPCSKDSSSEHSKSFEVKKSEDLPVESGNNSEMEEGELEPEPETVPVVVPVAEGQTSPGLMDNQECDSECRMEGKLLDPGCKSLYEQNLEIHEKKSEVGPLESAQDLKKLDEKQNCENTSIIETCSSGDVTGTAAADETSKNAGRGKENSESKEEVTDAFAEKSPSGQEDKSPFGEEELKEGTGINLGVKADDVDFPSTNKGVADVNDVPLVISSLVTEERTQNFKDKGKSVAVLLSNGTADFVEDSMKIERESHGFLNCSDRDMEGPSTRGFELFFADPVKNSERLNQPCHNKPKDEKLVFEPLELSLSLPNVLLPIGSNKTPQAPGSPSHARSGHSFPSSFQTNSDGFTASMSFSGSQPFAHNPSCSLTQNSLDNFEQSVGSRPIFQGMDWQGQTSYERKNKDIPACQRVLSNGNGFYHQAEAPQGISNGQDVQVQPRKVAEGTFRLPVGLDRQLSFNKSFSGQSRHPNDVRSPSQSVGSHETGAEYGKDGRRVMRERNGGTLHMGSIQDEKDLLLAVGSDFFEPIIAMIVSDPLHTMAQKFKEMTTQSIACLKQAVCDIILNPSKQRQLAAFQKTLQSRSDITLEVLLKSHRSHLEILVALKTGLQDFLQQNYDILLSDLAEIFLNLRCRNLTCRNLLPVDECDCKVCAQKNGFCSACMCLVCSKFDMASNTCSWVGCDVCLHWCHADCGLRESYIRNGNSATRASGTTEMQFHCVACDHPSEMFGFVKEVFQNFAKDWTAETLSKELEYVRRIFFVSEDVRGKKLHEIAIQMLSRLENKSDFQDVQNQIMGFFAESDSFKTGNTLTVSGKKDLFNKNQGEGSNGFAGSSHEPKWLKSFYPEKASHFEKAGLLPAYDCEQNDKHAANSCLERNAQKGPVFDELESIVRIKLAEAKMFQTRADDARREAEGLKRIAVAKNEKIEEEYTSRIMKLRLAEAEEMRKQKFEELQALEKAHREYINMKIRMETDIRDLLLKMEATKRNLPA